MGLDPETNRLQVQILKHPQDVRTWPEFLNLEAIAPATALSKSALSKTMKGAWPPSSMETFFMVSAACFRRIYRVEDHKQ